MAKEKHVAMKHSLAKALLESGIQHLDTGGTTTGGLFGALTPQSEFQVQAPNIRTQGSLAQHSDRARGRAIDVYGQQSNLAQALLNQSQGVGPNPALTQLNTQTGNNVANTAALIASSRGAGANPGLAARSAATIGANTQQQAVGQAATLQAQQELAAQQALAGVYQNQAANSLQGESIEQGALAAQNSAITTGELGASQINAQTAIANANAAQSTGGGLLGGVGSVLGGLFSEGGEVPNYDSGGITSYSTPVDPKLVLNFKSGGEGAGLEKGIGSIGKGLMENSSSPDIFTSGGADNSLSSPLGVNTAIPQVTGTTIPGVVGNAPTIPELMPAFGTLPPTGASLGVPLTLSNGGPIDFRTGGPVPGHAAVQGDSPKNDTVPALVSPGEGVIPRSIMQSPDAPQKAKEFVEALKDRKGDGTGFGKVLKAKASLKDRIERLEQLCGGGMT